MLPTFLVLLVLTACIAVSLECEVAACACLGLFFAGAFLM
jgi:hypothetical protein